MVNRRNFTHKTPVNLNLEVNLSALSQEIRLNQKVNSLPQHWFGFITDGTGEVIDPDTLKIGDTAYFVVYETLGGKTLLSSAPISTFDPLMALELKKTQLTSVRLIFKIGLKIGSLLDKITKKTGSNLDPAIKSRAVTSWKVVTPIVLNGIYRTNVDITTENSYRELDGGRVGVFEWTVSILDNIAYKSDNKSTN